MVITVTLPPYDFLSCKAASIPFLSTGLMIVGIPSLVILLVTGSMLTLS
jgi:hypothetical protein